MFGCNTSKHYLSLYLSIYLSIYLSVCLSIYLYAALVDLGSIFVIVIL
jgi:hypothetical protein